MSPRSQNAFSLTARLRDSVDGWMLTLADVKNARNCVRLAPPSVTANPPKRGRNARKR